MYDSRVKKEVFMNKNIKRGLVALALILALATGIIVGNQSPNAPLKDGSNIVYESDFGQLSAKEYYALMTENQRDLTLYAKFEKDILSSFTKDESIKDTAKSRVAMVEQNLNEENRNQMDAELRSMGYDGMNDLTLFYENMIYRDRIADEYVKANIDEIYPTYAKEYNPRTVSHILIKVADVSKPTEEEISNLTSIRQRILDGEAFETVAKEVSDDTSKEQGGYLGLMDKNTPFIPSFLEAALKQEAGEIYDWIPSEYGFHLILVNSTDAETIKKENELPMQIVQSEPQISITVMTKIIKDSNIEFIDKDFEKKIFDIMGGAL